MDKIAAMVVRHDYDAQTGILTLDINAAGMIDEIALSVPLMEKSVRAICAQYGWLPDNLTPSAETGIKSD